MRFSGIISIAAVCGAGAFVYTLVVRSPAPMMEQFSFGRGAMRAPLTIPADLESLERRVKSRPRDGSSWFALARMYRDADRDEEAHHAWVEAAKWRWETAQAGRDDALGWFESGWAYSKAGMVDEAREAMERAEPILMKLAHDSRREEYWYRLGWARKILGNDEEAHLAWLNARDVLLPIDGPGGSATDLYDLACYRALVGERAQALDTLARAVQAGWAKADTASHDEDLETLREEPRFKELLSQMGRRGSDGVGPGVGGG